MTILHMACLLVMVRETRIAVKYMLGLTSFRCLWHVLLGDPALVQGMQHMHIQQQQHPSHGAPNGNGSNRSPRSIHVPRPPPVATNLGGMYPPPQHYEQGSPHMGMDTANGHGHGGRHMDYSMMGHAPQASPMYADGGMPSPFFVPPSPSDVSPGYTSSPYNVPANPNVKPQQQVHTPNGTAPVVGTNADTTPAPTNGGDKLSEEGNKATLSSPVAAANSD